MNSKTKIYTLLRGTHIISADSRIWEITNHDYPYTRLISGCDTAYVDTRGEAVKIKGGYVIYEE
nr:MAG TPA: hypothetical protein [Bacteriophage sp.]